MPASLLAIGFGLGAAMCFGTGDFLAQRLTRRHGWFAAMFAVQLTAALALGVAAITWEGEPSATLRAPAVAATLVALGVANTLGLVFLYRAFESGKLSLVSPIVGSMGAFAVLFAWLGGSPPRAVVVPGVIAVVVGIATASVVHEPPGSEARGGSPELARASGVGWALASAVAFGWVFFALGPSSETVGPAWTVFCLRIVAIVGLGSLAAVTTRRLSAPLDEIRRHDWLRLLAVAMCDSGGMLTFAYASSQLADADALAVLVVLTSSFPIITIALAQLRLRESLRWWQWLGVLLVVLGVAWISAWSSSP